VSPGSTEAVRKRVGVPHAEPQALTRGSHRCSREIE